MALDDKEILKKICKNFSILFINPIALRMAKTPWSFGHSECNRYIVAPVKLPP